MLIEAEFASSHRSNRKNQRRHKKSKTGMTQSVVQRLFETCQEVFSGSGTVLSPEDVLRLKSVLDTVTVSDVGVNPNMRCFRYNNSEQPPITYVHIYECNKFSIGIFCLPPSGVIPLHNHPGMTVFSKLLFGSMHVKSYDWIDTTQGRQVGPSLALVKSDNVITAPYDTTVLYPNEGGNMHCFTAHGPCAVLDVLGPPYSIEDGRHCTYYNDFPVTSNSGDAGIQGSSDAYAWLEAIDRPGDFLVVGAPYRGPRIIEH